jgi:hypothetical protein
MTQVPGPELQREVQRLLGRCLLRLQQYEQLLKAVLAHHEVGGSVDKLEAQQDLRIRRFSDKTLGTLVRELFETVVVVLGSDRPFVDDARVPTDRFSMRSRFQFEMSEDGRASLKATLEELVTMRNDIVHHLIERFHLLSDDGCAAAVEHLNRCYERVDRHFEELRQLAEEMKGASQHLASFLQSEAFTDFVLYGISPDGTVDWPHARIVTNLREAATTLSTDGWVRLGDATAWINEHQPGQTPQKYGCRSWPQVLSDSRLFQLQYRTGDDGLKAAWYRAL